MPRYSGRRARVQRAKSAFYKWLRERTRRRLRAARTFASRLELAARDPDYDPIQDDPFVRAGLSSSESESDHEPRIRQRHVRAPRNLAAAKARRLQLKEHILRAREERARRRERRAAGLGSDSDSDDA